jgi:hypothetical protein
VASGWKRELAWRRRDWLAFSRASADYKLPYTKIANITTVFREVLLLYPGTFRGFSLFSKDFCIENRLSRGVYLVVQEKAGKVNHLNVQPMSDLAKRLKAGSALFFSNSNPELTCLAGTNV